jgi:2-oxoglutarate dehydrogenase E2 component (dihydrolipoamide succinyltransferase)
VPAEIHVPELGESVADATVGRWLKQEGETVKSGEPLVELETDKINFEVEAEQDGVLESIAKGEGESVNVGEVIATIGEGDGSETPAAEEEEETGAPEEEAPEEEAEAEQPEAGAEAGEAAEEEAAQEDGHREVEDGVRASPSVRKLAREYEIDLAEISGSGSGGRVTREDVERLIREQGRGAPAREAEQPEEDGLRSGYVCRAAGSPSRAGSSSRSRTRRCSRPSTRRT